MAQGQYPVPSGDFHLISSVNYSGCSISVTVTLAVAVPSSVEPH